MVTRALNGYDDSDVAYAAAQFAGHQCCLRLIHGGGEEIGGAWHSLFIFLLDDGQYGVVHGEEEIARTSSNWTSFVHADLAYIKETYVKNHGKEWAKTNVDTDKTKEVLVDVDQADVQSVAALLQTGDPATTEKVKQALSKDAGKAVDG